MRKGPITGPKWKTAHRARRHHRYWLVLRKSKKCESAGRVDRSGATGENGGMDTTTEPSTLPAEVRADVDAVLAAITDGRMPDPEAARRVREYAERARRENLARHGVQDIGVRIIRELRGGLPE